MILYENTLPVRITPAKLETLADAARCSPRRRARFILHSDHADAVQEMVIAITASTYIMPHRQADRTKSYLLLSGRMGVVLFDQSGQISNSIRMGTGPDDPVCFRFDAGQWHSVVSDSESSIYVEIAQGPFEGSHWADWAPKSENSPEGLAYLDFMKRCVFGD